MHMRLIEYDRLTNGHTGKYLAEKLVECLTGYSIEKKVCRSLIYALLLPFIDTLRLTRS